MIRRLFTVGKAKWRDRSALEIKQKRFAKFGMSLRAITARRCDRQTLRLSSANQLKAWLGKPSLVQSRPGVAIAARDSESSKLCNTELSRRAGFSLDHK